MESNKDLFDLLMMIVPALLVLGAAVLIFKRLSPGRADGPAQTGSLRLQAYERLVLLVERISPSSLLVRNHRAGLSSTEFNAILIAEVRAEFEHNITQQLYVSEKSWQMARSLKDRTISMINGIAQKLPEGAGSTELSKAVLNHIGSLEQDPYQQVLAQLRNDVKALL